MKYLILTLLISYFNPVSCLSQETGKGLSSQKKDSIIVWSKKRKLTWDDFKGVKNDTVFINLAESYTEIRMIPYLNKFNTYSYIVLAFFHKNKSFTNTNSSDNILCHEQLHFDITELFARKIRQEIQIQESKSSYVNYSSIYKKIHKNYRMFQKLYDAETVHSTNFEMQQKWKNDIVHKLEKLKNYEF